MTDLRIDTFKFSPFNHWENSLVEVGSPGLDKYKCFIDAANWYMSKQVSIQK
jgi:hypothetical protein